VATLRDTYTGRKDHTVTDTQTNDAPATHYDRIGGAGAVKLAVDQFYDRVLADPDLAGYFANVDMEVQRWHMVLMLTTVLGGPNTYTGRGLAEAHQPLDIPVEHYERVGAHLTATLSQLDVPADILSDVQAVLAQVQDQVVSSGMRPGV
jgi:hemoglobin